MIIIFWIILILGGGYIVGTIVSSIISQGTITWDWPLELLSRMKKSR